ncbi:hypothetical protein EVAR_79160_1 [Eumeta japonica]|uniref:Uncharacterized protein n=1 Tax=Eumeta variegata TaxID=151549 RepID=A0A4C1UT21_EUMVA|nr:hypothetical protein EVAR_79160_1 [Eumeta japonica]
MVTRPRIVTRTPLRQMSGPTLDQRVPAHSGSQEKPSCVNCGQQHTANGDARRLPNSCPEVGLITRGPLAPVAPPRDLENFPALASNRKTTPVVNFRPAPAPSSNPWGRNQPPRAVPEPPREPIRRAPQAPLPATATAGASSFGNDIQTVMAVLRAVSSSEIAEFAGQLRACRNVEEKLLVLVRYHDLMVRLESI